MEWKIIMGLYIQIARLGEVLNRIGFRGAGRADRFPGYLPAHYLQCT